MNRRMSPGSAVPARRPSFRGVALVAAVLVAAGTVITSAGPMSTATAGSVGASSFVPVTPCRLVDTRPGVDNVGVRSVPLGAGETFVAQVSGSNGNCVLPVSATAVSLNVTVIGGSASSFLTVFPSDKGRPLAASLNWVAGQAPTPNAVTAPLSVDGKVSFFNLAGRVDLTVDVVGFYEPAASGPPGPQGAVGAQGPVGPTGARGSSALDVANVLYVAKSGGDFTSLAAAMAAATPTGPTNRFLIKVGPGVFVEPGGVSVKDYVDVEGSGQNVTVITCGCSSNGAIMTDGSGAVLRFSGANRPSEVRDLTVENTGGPGFYSVGVWNSATTRDAVSLLDVSVLAYPSSNVSVGIYVTQSSPRIHDSDVFAGANVSGTAIGVWADASSPTLVDTDIEVEGGAQAYGVLAEAGSGFVGIGGEWLSHQSSTSTIGAFVRSASAVTLTDVTISGRGEGTGSGIGILTEGGTVEVESSEITAANDGTGPSYGIRNASFGGATVRSSTISGVTASVANDGVSETSTLFTVKVDGPLSGSFGFTCRQVRNAATLTPVVCPV